jgi:LDH2 family malate/lactate/ureidoglycolate dehydrogenase
MADLLAGVLWGASSLTRISSWSEDAACPQDVGHVFALVAGARVAGDAALAERVAALRALAGERER